MLSHTERRILFVDDDRSIHRAVTRMLGSYELCSAYDGPSALAELQTAIDHHEEFALVILDIGMPGWGGIETLERIWKIAPDTQALFCTGAALGHHELQDKFGDTDAILAIKKPFSHVELAQAAQALTTKWRLQREARAQVEVLEAALSARTAELEIANARLAEQLAWRHRIETEMRVSQRLKAVGELAAGIAHEINNPLQYVGDHLEFVHDATADLLSLVGRIDTWINEQREPRIVSSARAAFDSIDLPYMKRELPGALDAIQDGIQRISSIVRSMKELSHPGTADARAADINRALESALEISANAYRGVADLEKRLEPLPLIPCFVSELGQVFLNLIINAAHAMEGHARGKLVVTSQVHGTNVVISISDTGGGIPLEIQQRIFEPFFTTKEVGHGTGQGLAIARAIIVDRHGGSLSFESVVDHGTTFFIRIPLCGPPQPPQAAATTAAA